ncbi:MAG: EamA family transporter [Gallionellaceae bacterium]|jgi:multidrug transporter EmrE-like cation transporter|nr:EamA family transporter [Gallionellaceae bacterium]
MPDPTPHTHGLTRGLAFGLALAVILDTAGQLLWKFAVERLPDTPAFWPTIEAVAQQPWFLAVIAVFLCQLFVWLKVLENADLSFAQPITSLSYLTVCGFSWMLFDDHIGPLKGVGILCVLAGVLLISRGKRQTHADPDAQA